MFLSNDWCRSKIFYLCRHMPGFRLNSFIICPKWCFLGPLSVVPWSGHVHFCPHPSKFIIHDISYHSGLHRLNIDHLSIMQVENFVFFVLFVHFLSVNHFSSVIVSLCPYRWKKFTYLAQLRTWWCQGLNSNLACSEYNPVSHVCENFAT